MSLQSEPSICAFKLQIDLSYAHYQNLNMSLSLTKSSQVYLFICSSQSALPLTLIYGYGLRSHRSSHQLIPAQCLYRQNSDCGSLQNFFFSICKIFFVSFDLLAIWLILFFSSSSCCSCYVFSHYFAQYLLLKRVKCPPCLFSQPKQLNLVPRSSRLTVH